MRRGLGTATASTLVWPIRWPTRSGPSGLLRSAGDVWSWLLDTNRQRVRHGLPPVVGYQALCRELTARGPAGELSTVGARSVLGRSSDAWFRATKRRRRGESAGFPRRKRRLVPIRCYHGTFLFRQGRVRLPVARDHPVLWVRLARPIRGRCRRGSLASVGPGDAGRELPAPARPAGPPREGCEAGTQARPEGSATPSTSQARTWAGCRTSACGSGDAPTLCMPYGTRPSGPA